ncbi:GAL4 & fungal specific transcription factor domain-containing protein, priB [Histoplasma capsulatum]|uniref:GAL4 & fungal specific transcription factor domain-containing protein, priB n=1 Tax=Ajellomyces capsulatus TaxID=5037 RepID=A0A8A1M8S6_AJECA|nr:predicted protein [Histoplasma mississippiense (nom. inval.)]EDN07411.1 predicted protein [Histoplasma mississippiense (nom. inval.)]QSS61143.1 GAL4 & fungal specific transcription factor domain-containing protein, priB [Histoplasma capsulatum]
MPPGAANSSMVACTPCRVVKMKCTRELNSTICSRCKRKSLTCYFEAHRRGRKPGTRLRPKPERIQERGYLGSTYRAPSTPSTDRDVPASVERKECSEPSLASDSLAPYGWLPKSATAGKFSIANVLNAEDESPTHHASEYRARSFATDENYVNDMNDPINLDIVDLPTSRILFENFFNYMNPFICQFDPRLHTLKYIRTRSSFLFSAVLAAAAKIFKPSLYSKLHEHVEHILKDVLSSGKISTEIVQGICLLTYWKEPSDSRAWLLVGYAIRAAIEMGWHKFKPPPLHHTEGSTREPMESEIEVRELRSKERSWLMLFVYDRSVSLQLGKPWMIQIDSLIRSAETWHQHVYAVPGCDQIMSAFVQLRILGSEIVELFWIDPVATTAQSIIKNEVILKLFNGELDRWEAKWYKIVEEVSTNVAHRFIIRFYGTHLRLLLNSFRLQLSILSGNISKQALWVCYTSSLDMLRLVVDRLGVTSHSPYCQDSVHVMVAYAAVVMIKILLSLPGELPVESESLILELISETGKTFSTRGQATNTSSYHQSRFLANVVAQYRKSKEEPSFPSNKWLKQQHQLLEQRGNLGYRLRQLPPPQHQGGNTASQLSTSPPQTIPPLSPPTVSGNVQGYQQTSLPPPQHREQQQQLHQNHFDQPNTNQAQITLQPDPHQFPQVQANTQLSQRACPPLDLNPCPVLKARNNNIFTTSTQNNIETFMAMEGQSTATPLFTDNLVWEDLFAHAGFNISSGAFLPKLADGTGMGA